MSVIELPHAMRERRLYDGVVEYPGVRTMRARLAMVVAALLPLIAATHAVSADPMAPSGASPPPQAPPAYGKRSTTTPSSPPAGS